MSLPSSNEALMMPQTTSQDSDEAPSSSSPHLDRTRTVMMQDPAAESEPAAPARRGTAVSNAKSSQTVKSKLWPPSQWHVKRVVTMNLDPGRQLAEPPGFWQGMKTIIFGSYLNLLLIFIPLSWAFHFASDNDILIFVFSFLAIIPLAKLLAIATDELSKRVGQTLAGLINATLGNAVELIVAIIAITQCQLTVVQSSLVGSILSNLLLVLGMCFFAGGTKFSEQGFGATTTQINSSLLTISVIAVLLPAAFHLADNAGAASDSDENVILQMSHGVAIILLFIYGCYLVFQLVSHAHLYDDKDIFQSTSYPEHVQKIDAAGHPVVSHRRQLISKITRRTHHVSEKKPREEPDLAPAPSPTLVNDPTMRVNNASTMENGVVPETVAEEDDDEKPQMTLVMCLSLLACVTVVVAITAEFLVDSINGVTDSGGLSKTFVGLILLPIVGNAAEHVTAVTVSVKDKLNLSIGVAVGSSIQIALFVIPFMVVLAWILGKPLSLLFDPFESVTLFLTVITVNYVVADGRSNWLEGMILMCLYVIIAVSFWFYDPDVDTTLPCN